MSIGLLYFQDCPKGKDVDGRLKRLATERPALTVTQQLVKIPEQAERVGFLGSPSVQVDGVDVFAGPGSGWAWLVADTRPRAVRGRPDPRAATRGAPRCVTASPPSRRLLPSWVSSDSVVAFRAVVGGVLGAVAGPSAQSWALIGLGLVLAILGWTRQARHRRRIHSYELGRPCPGLQPTPDQSPNTTAPKGNHP